MTFNAPDEVTDSVSIVDIIISVRNNNAAARRCLASIYTSIGRAVYEIIVIDDASDDPGLRRWLDTEAAAQRITLIRNEIRRGYAASVNSGLLLHPTRDVVLLDSDTEVANNWLDRMLACANSAPDIGTVTPFSNNAEACAYPFEGWIRGVPGDLGLTRLDALFSETNTGLKVELAAAEGFCVLITRDCLNRTGNFDTERFGEGYGEDVDFSRRAAAVGFKSMLAADVFIYRAANVVIGPDKLDIINKTNLLLSALYPDFGAKAQRLSYLDAPGFARARINAARATFGGGEFSAVMNEQDLQPRQLDEQKIVPRRPALPVVLHITHRRAGSVRWFKTYHSADLSCRNLVLRGRPSRNETTTEVDLIDLSMGLVPLMTWTLIKPIQGTAIEHAEYANIIRWVCKALSVRAIMISSLVGASLEVFDAGVPAVWIAHDLFPLCPARHGVFRKECKCCGKAELTRCHNENPQYPYWSQLQPTDWLALRSALKERVAATNPHLVAPGERIRDRWIRLFPGFKNANWTVIPNGLGATYSRGPFVTEKARRNRSDPLVPDDSGRFRVLVPGKLTREKGLALWQKLFDELRSFADILLLGCGDYGRAYENYPGVEVVADIDIRSVPERVARWRPHCALLISELPESFDWTFSDMEALALPSVTVGPVDGRRIDDGWNAFVVDPDVDAIINRLRALDASREKLSVMADILRFNSVRTGWNMVLDYKDLMFWPDWEPGEVDEGPEALLASLGRRLKNQHEITRLRNELGVREHESRARDDNQRRLEAMVLELAAQHASTLLSLSWRVGAPIRLLERALQRLWYKLARRQPERVRRARPTFSMPLTASDDARASVSTLRSRSAARYWLCDALGIPDTSVIVSGGGAQADTSVLKRFLSIAATVSCRSPRACFVWCGPIQTLALEDLAVARALRDSNDLFVVDTNQENEAFSGADVLLLPATQGNLVGGPESVAGIPRIELPPEADTLSMDATVLCVLQYCNKGQHERKDPPDEHATELATERAGVEREETVPL